jgi:hypothetical protein
MQILYYQEVLEGTSQNNQGSTDDLTTADVETNALVAWWLKFYIILVAVSSLL